MKNKLMKIIAVFTFMLIGIGYVNAADITGLTVSPTSIDFGSVEYLSNSTQDLLITNNSGAEITFDSITTYNANKFEIIGSTPGSLADGGTTTIRIGLTNCDTGTCTDNVTFTSGADKTVVPITANVTPKLLPIPTVKGTYTYNGYAQTVELEGFDDSLMVHGSKTATDAGTHATTVSFKSSAGNYAWSDGTDTEKSINWTIEMLTPVLTVTSFDGKTGDKLDSITLPTGWTWEDDTLAIKAGANKYNVEYISTDATNINDVSVEVTVNGKNEYTIKLPTDAGVTYSKSGDIKVLDGETASVMIYAKDGYVLTSVKVDGVEKLASKVGYFDLSISNVTKNMDVEIMQEQVIYYPTKGQNLKHVMGTTNLISFTFDLDFKTLNHQGFYLNDELLEENVDFTLKEGSVIFTLSNEKAASLKAGTYTVKAIIEGGDTVMATFTVEAANPKTGDNVTIYASLLTLSIIGLGSTLVYKKLKK